MNTPEFSRIIDRRQIIDRPVELEANEQERAMLAGRFGLVGIDRLQGAIHLITEGDVVRAEGRLQAAFVQSCAVSGEDLPRQVDEKIALRFVPATETAAVPDEEIELEEGDCDEIPYSGHHFDLGEALAQSLALAIDPYATGPDADRARKAAGIMDEAAAGPFAALAALRRDN
ncbi:DUF177 domain-containing protein [Altererythrobacter xixiisoli]|uniref:DUF177 domain-containing protein n=1 Tax=Croceibacterium xixiisoli TaxID=1476466 RepID=A0A6I4U0S7_9SPHN|nr:DUF177 domain-containing protein [Croceibacterium xixiisoli]MXP00920.1 DUF177 domain-containing protein [Croceibacterium xixiisoli]